MTPVVRAGHIQQLSFACIAPSDLRPLLWERVTFILPYNTIQYNTIKYNIIQYNAWLHYYRTCSSFFLSSSSLFVVAFLMSSSLLFCFCYLVFLPYGLLSFGCVCVLFPFLCVPFFPFRFLSFLFFSFLFFIFGCLISVSLLPGKRVQPMFMWNR